MTQNKTAKETKMTSIKFTTDKHGRRLAYRWSNPQIRWFRMGLEEAKLAVATGAARDVTCEAWTISPGLVGRLHEPALRVVG